MTTEEKALSLSKLKEVEFNLRQQVEELGYKVDTTKEKLAIIRKEINNLRGSDIVRLPLLY